MTLNPFRELSERKTVGKRLLIRFGFFQNDRHRDVKGPGREAVMTPLQKELLLL